VHRVRRVPGHLSWSPDGSKIAFVVGSCCGPARIVTVNADGTGFQYILSDGTGPEWTADASRLLFWASGPTISSIKPDGTDLQFLASGYGGAFPSPDGTRIAVNNAPGAGMLNALEIISLDRNGDDPVALTSNSTRDETPAWQPVLRGYARPKGAGTLHAPLVPAYAQCSAPNRVHADPLSFGSCNPPTRTSSQLTSEPPTQTARPPTRTPRCGSAWCQGTPRRPPTRPRPVSPPPSTTCGWAPTSPTTPATWKSASRCRSRTARTLPTPVVPDPARFKASNSPSRSRAGPRPIPISVPAATSSRRRHPAARVGARDAQGDLGDRPDRGARRLGSAVPSPGRVRALT
jgi:hypothetical protein